jgi:hypothetical protein
MAGFEVVVRPMVLPNIRPAPSTRVLQAEDDPASGMCTIGGSGGGGLIDLPRSWNVSVSYQKPQRESTRVFDKQKVYQVDEQGNINRSNFVEVERLKKVRLDDDKGSIKVIYADPPERPNVETTAADVTRSAS